MIPWLPLCLVALAAGFLQGVTGFGSVLLSLPLLSIFMPIKTVIPLVALFALGINAFHSVNLRRHLRFRELGVLMAATLPGLPLGVWALAALPAWTLTLLVGAMLVPFAIQALAFSPQPRRLGPGWAVLAGLLAGFLGGSVGANGPPVIVYAARQPWSRNEAKALMAGYFLAAGVFIVIGQGVGGMITSRVLQYYAAAAPSLALGVGLGVRAYGRLDESGYRKLVYLLVLVLGLFMLARGLLQALPA